MATEILRPNAELRETCQQYLERRLSEGWKVCGRYFNTVLISPPDGSFLRPVNMQNDILTLRPNAAGARSALSTYDSATNWQNVDEVTPDNDTTYNYKANAGTEYDLYGLPNHTTEQGIINSVRIYIRCRETGGDCTARERLRTDTSVYSGTLHSLGTGYVRYNRLWNTNPKTGSAWTWAQIDALQAGVELEGDMMTTKPYTIFEARCTQLYVEVDYTPFVAPTVSTVAANNVEETTANPRGNVTATGGENPTRYIDYDIDSGAPYANSKNCGVGGTGEYNSNLTGLSPGQKYYYRARAVNSGGTGTGSEMTFTTKPNPPTALSATVVSSTQINVGWTKGTGAEKTMVRRKIGSYPTSVSDGDQAYFDTGNSFSDTGLDPGKHYYYRAWSYKTGAPNAGYSDEYAQDDGETPYPHSYGFIIG